MTAVDPIVRLDGVTKTFGGTAAVDALDLAVDAGQFVTLLGPSGCGKSTTLRLLGGFETPDRGRIVLDGRDVTRIPPERRDVNMVFQDYALFPHMTVGQNVAFGLELKGLTRNETAARVDALLQFLQLDTFAERRPERLSGGQRQRVALARALAPDPKLLLLDEPLAALDAKLRGQVQVELKSIQRRTGKTFVFVTHDQDEALTMSDRIVVMNKGAIEQDGTPEDLYHRPVSRFVADFIGETNFFACEVVGSEGDHLVLDWHGLKLRAAAGKRHPPPGAAVEAALRPESVTCSPARPDLANVFQARVLTRLFKGSRTVVDFEIDAAQGQTIRAALDQGAIERLDGDRAWIGWKHERMAVLVG